MVFIENVAIFNYDCMVDIPLGFIKYSGSL